MAAGDRLQRKAEAPPAGADFMLLDDDKELHARTASMPAGRSEAHRFKGGAAGPRVDGWPSVAVPLEEQPTDAEGRARGRRLVELETLLAGRTLRQLHTGATGPERRWAAAALASMAEGSPVNGARLL